MSTKQGACEGCGARYRLPETDARVTARCGKCGGTVYFDVPATMAEAPAPPPSTSRRVAGPTTVQAPRRAASRSTARAARPPSTGLIIGSLLGCAVVGVACWFFVSRTTEENRKKDEERRETGQIRKLIKNSIMARPGQAVSAPPQFDWSTNRADARPLPEFTFAWPASAKATVDHHVVKDEKTSARMTFQASVKKRSDAQLVLSMRDYEFSELNGVALTPGMRKRMGARSEALASRLLVSPAGEYQRTLNLDELVGSVSKITPGAQDPAVQKMMRSRGAKQALQQASGEIWRAWVETWIGCELKLGEKSDQEVEMELAGTKVPARVVMENQGWLEKHPGHVALRAELVMEGKPAAKGLEQFVASIAGGPTGVRSEDIRGIRIAQRVRIATDPRTLLPLRVETGRDIIVRFQRRRPEARHDRKTYDFSWGR